MIPEAAMRLLVAEDDQGLREALSRGLQESGYTVDAVPDGEVAVDYLRSYSYEVVVLDWRMPSLSGLEVLAGCGGPRCQPRCSC